MCHHVFVLTALETTHWRLDWKVGHAQGMGNLGPNLCLAPPRVRTSADRASDKHNGQSRYNSELSASRACQQADDDNALSGSGGACICLAYRNHLMPPQTAITVEGHFRSFDSTSMTLTKLKGAQPSNCMPLFTPMTELNGTYRVHYTQLPQLTAITF